MLHISRGWNPEFAAAYFGFMRQAGVRVTFAGLSYYPNSWGEEQTKRFEETLSRVYEELGLPVWIAEFAYAAAPGFAGWEHALEGYPLSEDGQAQFVTDLGSRVFTDPRLVGAVYWTPEEAHSLFPWAVMGLFRPSPVGHSPGPRPALSALGVSTLLTPP